MTAARLGGLVVLFLELGSSPASAHEAHVVPTTPPATAVLRWVVLWVAALVVVVLLRRKALLPAAVVAVVSGVAATSTATWGFALVAVSHRAAAALWLGAVLALLSSRGQRRRLAWVAVPSGIAVGLSGVLLARLDRVGVDAFRFDQLVLLKTLLFGVACVAGLIGGRGHRPSWPRVEVLALSAASVVGSLLVLVPGPPAAGRPLASAAGTWPVTVLPQRPGLNLVHVDSDAPVLVAGRFTTSSAGAEGQWALVTLPAGRSVLKVGPREVLLDTGHAAPSRLLAGPDGPECASALLGAALAYRPLAACPSDELRLDDRDALVGLVTWLHGRGVRLVRLAGDSSARSRHALLALRVALQSNDLEEGDGGALIVTGGWSAADQALRSFAKKAGPPAGLYLAPWDLTGPLLAKGSTTAPLLTLPFDPTSRQAARYLEALPPGEAASASGLAAFGASSVATQIWATSPASIFPRDLGHDHAPTHGWFPGGALVPVGAINPRQSLS